MEVLFQRCRHRLPIPVVPTLQEQMLLDHLPAALEQAPPLDATEKNSILSHSSRATKKFNSFDSDSNGFLEGDELHQVALWVWRSFRVDGQEMGDTLVHDSCAR